MIYILLSNRNCRYKQTNKNNKRKKPKLYYDIAVAKFSFSHIHPVAALVGISDFLYNGMIQIPLQSMRGFLLSYFNIESSLGICLNLARPWLITQCSLIGFQYLTY